MLINYMFFEIKYGTATFSTYLSNVELEPASEWFRLFGFAESPLILSLLYLNIKVKLLFLGLTYD